MELKNLTYLIVLIAVVSVPLALSFNKKIAYYKNLKYILPAILISGIIFILWDIKFTEAKIWGIHPEYSIGMNFNGLPIEEWLFFLVIPYSCVFIYEVIKIYLGKYEYANPFLVLSLILIVVFALLSYFFRHQLYTFFSFLFSAVYLAYIVFRNQFKQHITKFYFSYFVSLIPYVIVMGILASIPVIEYSSTHIMNIRLINIPIEDFPYFFLMLLMVISIYEKLKESKYY